MILKVIIVDGIFIIINIILVARIVKNTKTFNESLFNFKLLMIQRNIDKNLTEFEEGLISKDDLISRLRKLQEM